MNDGGRRSSRTLRDTSRLPLNSPCLQAHLQKGPPLHNALSGCPIQAYEMEFQPAINDQELVL